MAKKDLLDIKLENSLAFQIDYTSNFNKSFRRAFHKKFMNSNISMDELAILLLINIRPDITQTALARYMFKGKAHVGKILNIMEEKGLIKRKYIELKPMDEDEAILQMELLNHDFYMFKNIETDHVAVIYRRKHNDYGLIEQE